jgi:hypothetical protein
VSRLIVRPADLEDAESLAPRLRQADANEIAACSGRPAIEALRDGVAWSADPCAVIEAGSPIALFGVVDQGDGSGSPWLLGSDRIVANWFEFARRSSVELARVREPWPFLWNYVHDENTLHKRWLGWLGFDFVHLEPHYGVARVPFWRFELSV